MKFRPARSSGPMLGGIGVSIAQHDGYMMFDVAFGDAAVGLGVAQPDGVADFVDQHAREVRRRPERRAEVGRVLKDDVAAREGVERRAVDGATRSAGPPATDGERRSADLVVRVFERDDTGRARQAGERAVGISLERRAPGLQDDRRGHRRRPGIECDLKLGDGVAARQR